jgi:hypothetical protein
MISYHGGEVVVGWEVLAMSAGGKLRDLAVDHSSLHRTLAARFGLVARGRNIHTQYNLLTV